MLATILNLFWKFKINFFKAVNLVKWQKNWVREWERVVREPKEWELCFLAAELPLAFCLLLNCNPQCPLFITEFQLLFEWAEKSFPSEMGGEESWKRWKYLRWHNSSCIILKIIAFSHLYVFLISQWCRTRHWKELRPSKMEIPTGSFYEFIFFRRIIIDSPIKRGGEIRFFRTYHNF